VTCPTQIPPHAFATTGTHVARVHPASSPRSWSVARRSGASKIPAQSTCGPRTRPRRRGGGVSQVGGGQGWGSRVICGAGPRGAPPRFQGGGGGGGGG
jgi:hypothetical protein